MTAVLSPHGDTATLRHSFSVDAAHPCLPGHFPDRPVVPGVVVLDRIAAAVEAAGWGRLAALRSVKFLSPLLPEQVALIDARREEQRLRFRVERDGAPILVGEGELA